MTVKVEANQTSSLFMSAKPQAVVGTPHFSELLNPRDAGLGRAPQNDSQKVRQAARQLVSTTLILPVLKQMRQDPLRSEMFHGGPAEDMFNGQLDQVFADRITARTDLPIVQAVSRSIMQRAEQVRRGKTADTAPASGSRLNVHG